MLLLKETDRNPQQDVTFIQKSNTGCLTLTGECSELGRLAKPLLVGGTRHGVEGLVQACEQHLAANLTPVTTPHTLLLAYKYSAESLLSATMKYAIAQV